MKESTLWGYQRDEYIEMFDLTLDKPTSFLEYHCGPSAFNQALTKHSGSVVSCDPLFELTEDVLKNYVEPEFQTASQQLAKHPHLDLSHYGGQLQTLIKTRKKGLELFFEDYEKGKTQARYQTLSQGKLPFEDFSFDIALSAYYLFVESEQENLDFYLTTLKELARVAKEVRLFPLVDAQDKLSPMLGPVLLGLQQEKYGVEVKEVPYRLQTNGNAMLRIWAQQCPLSEERDNDVSDYSKPSI